MNSTVLGIDIGSVAIGVAEVSRDGEVAGRAYAFHGGHVRETLEGMLSGFGLDNVANIAATASTPVLVNACMRVDNRVATIRAARRFQKDARAILHVGGEEFFLVRFDENGDYRTCRSNTSCAAGTGGFLDQQASRLGLGGSDELSRIALGNTGPLPKIATRCAVFAKTDLVHAQQEGYSLAQISDGLCLGLGRNIVDTLFRNEEVSGPLVMSGGVSLNRAVVRHLRSILGVDIAVCPVSHLFGAVGAALCLLDEAESHPARRIGGIDDILSGWSEERAYAYEPLELRLSDYPDFEGIAHYEYRLQPGRIPGSVEVDIYEDLSRTRAHEVYLGIDIGSTSTKAVLVDTGRRVLAGFYTRTAGRPVLATQALFEAMDHLARDRKVCFEVKAAGTTGSGRKLVGKIIGADLALDEITAHARAACELDPRVDTIIEIGGQDAKFTTLKDSLVTFSAMNAVCAAGTGSFIEELAARLSCPLEECSSRSEGMRAPMASDRCTVFMERDLNHYLSEGYSRGEVMAAALHAVRENYLAKVAVERAIGDVVFFQGATAKNRALVAAFEQRLNKPIHVSRFCHLTGALGTALTLCDEHKSASRFRGFALHARHIPVRTEVCGLCANHCKLTVADIDGEHAAYGFLCGRDYDTKSFVNNNRSGFDLFAARREIFSRKRPREYRFPFVVGLPQSLHMRDDVEFWQCFFDELGIATVTATPAKDDIKHGRRLAGAEFCAPVHALFGQVSSLLDKADYVFAPVYLEDSPPARGVRRQYCYYTQFSVSLVKAHADRGEGRILTPLVNYLYSPIQTKIRIHRALRPITGGQVSLIDVARAFEKASAFKQRCRHALRDAYRRELSGRGDISVVLLGRPYTVLSRSMNNGIVDIFASLGIKTFFQDMVPMDDEGGSPIRPLLEDLPWKYASTVLETAETVASTEGVYPVLVTSFKCAPDAFVMEYFKKVMHARRKPYLILQMDEHDSSVGYETRIEAAVRAFRNHGARGRSQVFERLPSLLPARSFTGKTVFFPNWDELSCRLLVANLVREGLDARLLEPSPESTLKGMRYNSGQCIPINIIAQEYIDAIERSGLDPARCALWMFRGEIACNLKLIPHHIKNVLNSYGGGMEKAEVYLGEISMMDISVRATLNAYFAFMFGGLLRRVACRIRPYEVEPGVTDRAVAAAMDRFERAFLGDVSKDDALREAIALFERIRTRCRPRVKVAIIGDIYVRDNDLLNQDLVRFIEAHGGEVITTPYTTYAKMIARPYLRKWVIEGKVLLSLSSRAILATLQKLEKRYYRHFQRILAEPDYVFDEKSEEILMRYGLLPEHTGETMDTILKVHYIAKHHPDLALFVLANPAFCCPGLVTEALVSQIERHTGVPVASITYDGTVRPRNQAVIPYLRYPPNPVKVTRGSGYEKRALPAEGPLF